MTVISETRQPQMTFADRPAWKMPGVIAAVGVLAVTVLGVVLTVAGASDHQSVVTAVGIVLLILASLLFGSFTVVQPNDSRVLTLFGRYAGTVRAAGWWWCIPFTKRQRISLRVRNFQSDSIKVNDASGNPIEIAAVVVWRVTDTAKAVFDVA